MLNAWKLQHIRCVQSDYGRYDVTEPPIDAPRDPLYKSDYEVLKASVNYWRTTLHFSLFLLFI